MMIYISIKSSLQMYFVVVIFRPASGEKSPFCELLSPSNLVNIECKQASKTPKASQLLAYQLRDGASTYYYPLVISAARFPLSHLAAACRPVQSAQVCERPKNNGVRKSDARLSNPPSQ